MVKLLNALNLFDSSGWIVGDLRAKDHGPGWAGAVVAIEPGSYRLRAQGPSNRDFELALAACNGWQTQIFLTCRDTEDSVPTVDLFRSSIFLVPIGRGFDPARPELRWIEQVRLGLVHDGDPLRRFPLAAR